MSKFGQVIVEGASGNLAEVNSEGQLHTVLRGRDDAGNSTTTLLAAGGIFPGASIDTLDYSAMTIVVHSDVASATEGLKIMYSMDGTVWHEGEAYTILAGATKFYTPTMQARYVKVTYENGPAIQTEFHLHVTLRKSPIKWSSHNINKGISGEDDAQLGISVIKGRKPDGSWDNAELTASGNLKVTDAESGLAIAKGDVVDTAFIHKFGAAPDFDVADGFVTVWDAAEDGSAWELMKTVYSTTANINRISSSSTSDTTIMEIQGLDANYNMVTQTATLTGQVKVILTTPLIRVFRVTNIGSVNLVGHVITYVDGTITLGVPTVKSTIRAVVQPENNQTTMAVFTIPAGYTGYLRSWYVSTAGAKKASSHTMLLKARPFGQVFQLKHKANIGVTGTSYMHHEYVEPEVFTEKTDIEIQMDTNSDSAGVAAGFDIVLIAN